MDEVSFSKHSSSTVDGQVIQYVMEFLCISIMHMPVGQGEREMEFPNCVCVILLVLKSPRFWKDYHGGMQ